MDPDSTEDPAEMPVKQHSNVWFWRGSPLSLRLG